MIWKRLFTKKSAAEKGTLYQLKNLLNRTAVPLDPSDNMKAAEDFLLVVLHSHIVAAAKAVLDESEAIDDVLSLSKTIVENYITITLPSSSANKPPSVKCLDKINMYATEVLTLGLLWHSFHDAIKEGDGDRIIRNWKFNLLAFKSARRKNYSIEALNLLLQVNYILSPREAAQVKWCRSVNTSGRQGHNIPMDLHLEHLNRRLKSTLQNMRSNTTKASIRMAAENVDVVNNVCHNFEKQTNECKEISDKHASPSFQKDLKMILSVLQEQQVFNSKKGRQHISFKFTSGLLQQLNYPELVKWIQRTTDKLL